MDEYEQVPVVGGPLDGQTRAWSPRDTLVIPDSSYVVAGVTQDGDTYEIFAEHTYKLRCYAKGGKITYRWEYFSFKRYPQYYEWRMRDGSVRITETPEPPEGA